MICSNFTTFVVESPMLYELQRIDRCCDLLKFHYLCGRITNDTPFCLKNDGVVICSNFTTFVVESPIRRRVYKHAICCDLLKFHYLCGRITNDFLTPCLCILVVICSNFTTFVVESPMSWVNSRWRRVVICSNFTTFVVESPMVTKWYFKEQSCDLLKFHYLCGRITNCLT